MAKVVSFISRKGGTGKTTVAIHLATALHYFKKKVVVIETDTNYTLSTLRDIELQSGDQPKSMFEIFGSTDEEVVEIIGKYRANGDADVLIVDSAGKTTDENIKNLALASDLIIIPTSLTKNDYLVTYQTVQDLKPATELKEDLKIVVLPNRVHALTKQETVENALDGLDAEILGSRVPQKNVFSNFSTIRPEEEFAEPAKEILTHLI